MSERPCVGVLRIVYFLRWPRVRDLVGILRIVCFLLFGTVRVVMIERSISFLRHDVELACSLSIKNKFSRCG